MFSNKNKVTFFDLDDLEGTVHEQRVSNPTTKDKVWQWYWTKLRGRKDFDYATKGIAQDTDTELLVIGNLTLAGSGSS